MDERLRILKMVEDGTITAEQAAELMKAMGVEEESQVPAKSQAGYDKKMFRIIVDSVDGDKVNVQFPVGAIKKILKVTGKLPIADKDLQGVDLEQMMEAISECLDEEDRRRFCQRQCGGRYYCKSICRDIKEQSMRVIVRSKDANFRMPVPIALASVVVKMIPKAVFDKMGEDVPEPYDSLISKDVICMIFDECMDVLKENKGLEIIHVEAVDGTFVSITL